MERNLDLLTFWKSFLPKRWKMLVILPLTAGLVAFLINTNIISPLYSASSTIVIMQPPEKQEIYSQDFLASRLLVETYLRIALSNSVLDFVIDSIEKADSTEESNYKASISRGSDPRVATLRIVNVATMHEESIAFNVEGIRDTEIIRLTITGTDPVKASDYANEWAESFKENIVELMQVENVNIINRAIPPEVPISPQVFLNTVAAILFGLTGALGIAILMEHLDQSIINPAEVQTSLNLPVLGVMPKPPLMRKVVMTLKRDKYRPSAEVLRSIWANVQYNDAGRFVKQVLITGINLRCETSNLATHLGMTIAASGESALLVDADLRRPTLHKSFNTDNEVGLSNLLLNSINEPETALRKSPHNRLMLLTTGPVESFAYDYIYSEQMDNLAADLAARFDHVIYVSSPLIAFSDSLALSKVVDGLIVTIDYRQVHLNDAKTAINKLKAVNAPITGIVINNIPFSKSLHNDYYSSRCIINDPPNLCSSKSIL